MTDTGSEPTLSVAPPTDGLLTAGASALAAMIARGDVSAAEVMDVHLTRIAAVEGRVHAFAFLDADAALARARAADARQAAGEPLGPLHGVPITVKDWIEAEGMPCASGYEERRNFVPRRDATALARLKAAGAVVIGKTVAREGEPMYPRPCNPHDVTRCTGASSSGEAAIVAAGGSPLGLASDSGGSIRLPAAWCGVPGLKPTQGRVPRTGHFPRIGPLSDPRTTIGPIARKVADLELALGLIDGLDDEDPSSIPVPLRASQDVRLADLRVAVVDFADTAPSAETLAAVQAAGRILEGRGALVEPTVLPVLEESLAVSQAYWARLQSISSSRWLPYGEDRLSGEEIERSIFRWEGVQRTVLKFMARYDAIVCPVHPTTAPPQRTLTGEDYLYMLPFSLTGHPVAAVPVARSAQGLPIGVQVVARRWRDEVAVAIGRALEAGT